MTFDGKINLLCERCGNATRTPRCDIDPPDAVLLEVSYCPICDVGGEFESTQHYRRDGTACDYTENEEGNTNG